MKEYKIDFEQSKSLYEQHKDRLEVKQCYKNVWYIATSSHHYKKFKTGEWKVAYGVMPSIQKLMVRHCFIVDDKGNAIDPTLFCVERQPDKDMTYIAHTVYKTFEDYFNAITDNDNKPDLCKLLRKQDIELNKELMKNGSLMIGW